MSLQKYTALLKAVELGSISRAAEQLGYTQSAVSRMIADLEREWGMELLHRGRGGIEITSVGRQLLPVLRSIEADCSELEHALQEIRGVQMGLVQVGTFTTVSDAWIPRLLISFREKYPNIQFKLLHSESYHEVEEWIRSGKVDCGFVRLPCAGDLQVTFLKQDMLAAVLPPEHPLAAEECVSADQLAGEPFVKLKVDYEISRFLEQLSAPPCISYEVSNDHTILSMVEAGLGISVLHSLMAEAERYRVVWRPLMPPCCRDLGIAVAKRARLSSAARLFVEHVCHAIPGEAR